MKFLKFSLRKFLKSFSYAVTGWKEVFSREQNFKVHTLLGILALLMGWWLNISPTEWCVILVVIALVLAAELCNTALENLCDLIKPEQNETVRIVKDMSAGMVLCCATGALLVGIVIFLPKLVALFQSVLR